ncbi:MAG: RecX family transcriptional regulator [Leptospiraceae bacterium]|nr:RecX family transcriptional regulator [Leptospiraceae bacterium]MDW7976803.1 RecX family transcriptional regulator [Leptospiraceae bacterium]
MPKDDLYSFLRKEKNVYHFDFKRFQNQDFYQYVVSKLSKISPSTPPSSILKKLRKMDLNEQKNLSFDFQDFLKYLENQNLWNYKTSLKLRMQLHLENHLGYHKIKFLLLQEGYHEEHIQEELANIPSEFWKNKALQVLKSLQKSLSNIPPTKRKQKIYNKLLYLGFREEEIEEIISKDITE